MTHVVTEPCNNCKYTDCVEACPVDCFHEGPSMLFIDPEECIDCKACVSMCPVNAIFAEADVPDKWKEYIHVNAGMAPVFPVIDEKKTPLV